MDNNLLLSLFLLILFSFLSYLVPSTFYPDVALPKGLSIEMMGFINSLFPIGGGFTSLYLGKNMSYYGRKNLI
jgi:MFS family permease